MPINPNPEANFTPPLKGYSGQGAFRFWCQTVLPIVYDDSLSYYELLNKVVNYLNNTISDVANVEDNVNALLVAYNQLQSYVNNYFDTLDVQTEINNKLDEMAESGELSEIISPIVGEQIDGAVAEQIGATVASQIGATVANQIGGAVAGQIGGAVALQIDGAVARQIDEPVSEQIGATVASQIGDVVATQIDGSVGRQIDASVARQIDEPVSEQIDGAVAEQISDVVAEQIDTPVANSTTAWLNTHVNPVGSAVIVDDTLTIAGAAADAKETGDRLAEKADTDGYYPQLHVGESDTAEQLKSRVTINDKVPYLFRPTAGANDVGNRKTMEVVGGTVAHNQLVENGNFTSTNGWSLSSSCTLSVANNTAIITAIQNSNTANINRNINAVNNHVFFVTCTITPSKDVTGIRIRINDDYLATQVSASANTKTKLNFIKGYTGATDNNAVFRIYFNYLSSGEGVAVNDTFLLNNVMLIDLTQMFGATIANNIYTLEQTTEGTGIEWFKHYYPYDYYDYNPGTLFDARPSKNIMTGFNQMKTAPVERVTAPTFDRTKAIHVVPNLEYVFKFNTITESTYWKISFCLWDLNENIIKDENAFIAGEGWVDPTWNITVGQFLEEVNNHRNKRIITFKQECWVLFSWGDGDTFSYANMEQPCFHFRWDGERDNDYEEYVKYEYNVTPYLDHLSGLPKLDENNNLYYDGDVYKNNGKIITRYNDMRISSVTDVTYANNVYYGIVNLSVPGIDGAELRFNKIFNAEQLLSIGNGYIANSGHDLILVPYDQTLTTKTAFDTWLSNNIIFVVYKRAEPIETDGNAYSESMIIDDWGTEEFSARNFIPIGHNTNYQPNLRSKLEMAPNSPDGNGDYLVRQTDGLNSYVEYTDGGRITAIENKIPNPPSVDGTYRLTCTVTDGTPSYSWEN